ncbi:hypothetical protein J4729_02825 [Leisingera sp. HS039]|uniref:hypothetical protein n=1 Tax=unclassified Leisingera TaxID=2614906 RepID=UPI0010706D7E|nr:MULTISPECIES: hypothetical protein [unclassified Leisingera]MBQ4823490.1 hypothetical protein [Leisingera sp. HS039]QBR37418.1 hypothetical protein ETW23_16130 [Leisingera sp. NJS201]
MSNVVSAKLFFGVVLDELQSSFPAAVHLQLDDLWPEFEKLAKGRSLALKDGNRSFREIPVAEVAQSEQLKLQYMKLMLGWMAKEGFLHSDPTSGFVYDYVLSSKALAVLGLSLAEEKTTLGDALGRATGRVGEAVQAEVVARLMDKAFEAIQGMSI